MRDHPAQSVPLRFEFEKFRREISCMSRLAEAFLDPAYDHTNVFGALKTQLNEIQCGKVAKRWGTSEQRPLRTRPTRGYEPAGCGSLNVCGEVSWEWEIAPEKPHGKVLEVRGIASVRSKVWSVGDGPPGSSIAVSNVVKPPPSCNVYTPAVPAQAMVRALGDVPDARWLEPCVGKGVFLIALARHQVDATRIVGLDLCRSPEPADVHAAVRRGIDFLRWATSTRERFDRVVCNPPYVALSKVPQTIQAAALSVRTPDGAPITRGGNCWNAFLCASLGLLNDGGSIAFVLPAAFDYANYAQCLRATLPTLFARLEVHRCHIPIFDAVQEGSIVLPASGFREQGEVVVRREYDTLDDLVRGLARPSQPSRQSPRSDDLMTNGKGIRLAEVMAIGLGAVTGDASYFLMTDEERRRQDLPTSAVVPVVSKSKHVRKASISPEYWHQLRFAGERVWLFRPRPAVATPRGADAMPRIYRTAIESLLDGDTRRASSIANKYIARQRAGAAAM